MQKIYSITKLLFLIILVSTFNSSFAQLFVDIGAGLTGVSHSSSSWGDFDNDKDLDILISGETSNGTYISRVYVNEGGTFSNLNADISGMSNSCIKWGDYDNDGDLDIIATGENTNNRSIIYRNDEGIFTDILCEIDYFGAFSHAAWGDYDNDGDLDIAITGSWMSQIYENTGADEFILLEADIAQLNSGRVAWGDYDNDGDLDLIIAGDTGGGMRTYLYKNTNGEFEQIVTSIMGLSAGSVEWGDYDSDGDLDVLIMGYDDYLTPMAHIYRNDGDNIFVDIYAGLAPVTLGKATWGDYDNDGDLDIAITGKFSGCGTFTSAVYENLGNDLFNDIMANLTSAEYSYITWGDYDNDTDLDLLVCGSDYSGGSFTKVYRNDASLPNILPEHPDNLNFEITTDGVFLSWDPGTDMQTPQDGLTYNLRIGTSPEGCNNLSPMSHTDNGYRKLITAGNTGLANHAIIRDLDEGVTYYWSVQTIDNTFAGSAFAPEQSFTLTYTGLEQLYAGYEIDIYPNPATDKIFVNLPESLDDGITMYITNLMGQRINGPTQINQVQNIISLGNLDNGCYFVEITRNNDLLYREKLLVR